MNYKIVNRYAHALYDTIVQTKTTSEVEGDAVNFLKLYEESRNLRLFFKSPVISKDIKYKVINALFDGKANKITVNFLNLLVNHNRETIVSDILTTFLVYKNEKEGRIPVEIKSAVELDENSKKKLIETINTFSGMECSATYELSKELIGGFTVKVKDEIIDASIKRQLENLKTELAKSEI